jgi:DNA (cytosine-5)-methyltransferase 1
MDQLNLFEVLYEKYKIKKHIRLIELFGGIGSQAKALENLHADFEHYKLVEYDKYPVASYNAIHKTNFVPTDITKIHAQDLEIVDRDKYEYLVTYSFPCQDLSLSGKGKGMKKGSGTRSGLLWEVERLLNECGDELPQVLLMENVPNVVGEKNIEDFKSWVKFLESKNYTCYYEILNAKNYGIPQNRQRCYMISILNSPTGEHYYYEFPKPVPLKLYLKDMLQPEDEVDKKYYLSKDMMDYICFDDISHIKNKAVKETLERSNLENVEETSFIDGMNRSIRSDGCAGTIDTGISFRNKQFLLIKNDTKQGYLEAREGDGVDISARMHHHRGTVQKGIAQTIKTAIEVGVVVKKLNLAVRKLTPKEVWRLMGFDDLSFERASKVNANSHLYKQAGNSIVVNVLMAIFSQLL